MQRKVIQQGPSTLMVSLPSKWVKENHIQKGQELQIELQQSQLLISHRPVSIKKKTHLYLKKKEEYLDRILMGKYREGWDEIYIKYDDPEILESIRQTLKYLLGFEIVDQTASSCTIKNISEGTEEEYPVMFRRMFQIMLTQADSCLAYAETQEEKHLTVAIDLRETLMRLEQFCLRLLNGQNHLSVAQKSLEFFYVWHLATFGRTWASFAKKRLLTRPKLSKQEVDFLREVVHYARDFYEAYYTREQKQLVGMKKKLYFLRPVGVELLEISKNKMVVFYLLRMLNRIYEIDLLLVAER